MGLILSLILGMIAVADAAAPQNAVVTAPSADVWSRPLAAGEKPTDNLRETQVLAGELVVIHEINGEWARIEAVEQPEFSHHDKWEGYPGWVLRKALGKPPFDKTTAAPASTPRTVLLAAAEAIGTPYLWGGLSVHKGLDCSGLTHLAYRQSNVKIPRDSLEQWMKATPIKRAGLKPGDLIFSAKAETPKKVSHVTFYIGNDQIFEAPQAGMSVRRISFKEKYGKDLARVESGDNVGERVIYFGSFLHP